MARINLLPWRDELRKQKQQNFLISIGLGVLATLAIIGLVHMQISAMIHYQELRNKMLKDQIARLDVRIKEIKDIETKKSQLLTKIELIQTLQESRPQIVHLFDEMAKTAPEGVFLSKFKQIGSKLVVDGKAKSNARVSAYMRSIDASEWLKKPKLDVIHNIQDENNSDKSSDFVMFAEQGQETPEQKKGAK